MKTCIKCGGSWIVAYDPYCDHREPKIEVSRTTVRGEDIWLAKVEGAGYAEHPIREEAIRLASQARPVVVNRIHDYFEVLVPATTPYAEIERMTEDLMRSARVPGFEGWGKDMLDYARADVELTRTWSEQADKNHHEHLLGMMFSPDGEAQLRHTAWVLGFAHAYTLFSLREIVRAIECLSDRDKLKSALRVPKHHMMLVEGTGLDETQLRELVSLPGRRLPSTEEGWAAWASGTELQRRVYDVRGVTLGLSRHTSIPSPQRRIELREAYLQREVSRYGIGNTALNMGMTPYELQSMTVDEAIQKVARLSTPHDITTGPGRRRYERLVLLRWAFNGSFLPDAMLQEMAMSTTDNQPELVSKILDRVNGWVRMWEPSFADLKVRTNALADLGYTQEEINNMSAWQAAYVVVHTRADLRDAADWEELMRMNPERGERRLIRAATKREKHKNPDTHRIWLVALNTGLSRDRKKAIEHLLKQMG